MLSGYLVCLSENCVWNGTNINLVFLKFKKGNASSLKISNGKLVL